MDIAIEDQSITLQVINGGQVKPAAFFLVRACRMEQLVTLGTGKWDLDSEQEKYSVTSEGYRILGANHNRFKSLDSIQKEDLNI